MDIKEAINILKDHNKWRIGSEEIKMAEPRELTEAINIVISFTENYQALQSELLCGSFEADTQTSSDTKCKCGREKWEHPKSK